MVAKVLQWNEKRWQRKIISVIGKSIHGKAFGVGERSRGGAWLIDRFHNYNRSLQLIDTCNCPSNCWRTERSSKPSRRWTPSPAFRHLRFSFTSLPLCGFSTSSSPTFGCLSTERTARHPFARSLLPPAHCGSSN